jgi:hypothetical protein
MSGAPPVLYVTIDTPDAVSRGVVDPMDAATWSQGAPVFRNAEWGNPSWESAWTDASGVRQPNLLSNPSFEEVGGNFLTGWDLLPGAQSVTQDCTVSYDPGGCSVRVVQSSTSANGVRSVRTPILPDAEYVMSVAARVVGGTANPNVFGRINWYDASGAKLFWPGEAYHWTNTWVGRDFDHDWRIFERFLRSPPLAAEVEIDHFAGQATNTPTATVWFDQAKIERTQALPIATGPGHGPTFGHYESVTVDPLDPDVAYVCQKRETFADDPTAGFFGGVWKSVDGGETWAQLTRQDDLSNITAARVAINYHPFACGALFSGTTSVGRDHVYLAAGRFLYRSLDAGATWVDVTGNEIQARPVTTTGTGRRAATPTTSTFSPLRLIRTRLSASITATETDGWSSATTGGRPSRRRVREEEDARSGARRRASKATRPPTS